MEKPIETSYSIKITNEAELNALIADMNAVLAKIASFKIEVELISSLKTDEPQNNA